jgi:hypothetical protein
MGWDGAGIGYVMWMKGKGAEFGAGMGVKITVNTLFSRRTKDSNVNLPHSDTSANQ